MLPVGETLARHLASFGELPAADSAAVTALKAEAGDQDRRGRMAQRPAQSVHDWPKLRDLARFEPDYLHLRSTELSQRRAASR